jgi:hypothetical protein
MRYEFGGCLYDTRTALLAAVAETWLTGGRKNSAADILAMTESDEALAAECLEAWELDQPRNAYGDETESQLEVWDVSVADLVDAVAAYRASLRAEDTP